MIGDTLTLATRRGRARAFANRHFHGSPTHLREATAVHMALERLSGRRQRSLDPEATIADVVGDPDSVRLARLDLEEVTELVLSLEAEGAFCEEPGGREPTRGALNAGIVQVLLGPAAKQTTWDPATPLDAFRSRGRQRTRSMSSGLYVSVGEGPSNNRMQRTAPSEMERRR